MLLKGLACFFKGRWGVLVQTSPGGRIQGAGLSGDGHIQAVSFGFQIRQLVGQAIPAGRSGVVTAVAAGADHELLRMVVEMCSALLGVFFTWRSLMPTAFQTFNT